MPDSANNSAPDPSAGRTGIMLGSQPLGLPPEGGFYKRLARQVEALGYDLLFAGDHMFMYSPNPEALTVLSLYAGATERVLLGTGVRDLTGGFKCFRRETLEAIDLGAVSARGYGFQIETTYRVLRAGLRVREIPIRFVERRVGDSKMSGAIVAEAAWMVPLLRLRALTGRL